MAFKKNWMEYVSILDKGFVIVVPSFQLGHLRER